MLAGVVALLGASPEEQPQVECFFTQEISHIRRHTSNRMADVRNVEWPCSQFACSQIWYHISSDTDCGVQRRAPLHILESLAADLQSTLHTAGLIATKAPPLPATTEAVNGI